MCSENKGADQLCGYRTADMRLSFGIICKNRFSHDTADIFLYFKTLVFFVEYCQ